MMEEEEVSAEGEVWGLEMLEEEEVFVVVDEEELEHGMKVVVEV